MPTGNPWAAALEASWWRAGHRPAWPLRLLARLFDVLSARRRRLYASGRRHAVSLDVPVLVIGNRIVGGAGKTPVALAVLALLRDAGWHPGLVSRGHGSTASHPRPVTPTSRARDVGDEPWLIARRAGVPVWVGTDRAACAQALRRTHPEVDVIVCDDGLQHRRLARDLALVVFDERGAGNGWLLPAGPLREPLDADTGAAQHWVVYNAGAASTPLPGVLAQRSLSGLVPLADWWAGRPALRDLGVLAHAPEPVWAVAGIGAPQRFFADLAAHGLRCRTLALADHDDFRSLPWPNEAAHVVVTEKDAAKLDPARVAAERPGCTVWVAPMRLTLPAALQQSLCAALTALKTQRAR